MKILVIYYSRTGLTKIVAEEIARKLAADLEEIKTAKYKKGIIGYLTAGRDAMKGRLPEIGEINKDLASYDLIIIGTPVWANNISAPIRAFISKYKNSFKKIALFCVMGGTGAVKTLSNMENISGQTALAKIAVRSVNVKKEEYKEMLGEYINKIR